MYILLTVYIIQSYTCASVCTRVPINRCFTCTCSTVLNSGVNFSMMGVKCLLVVFLLTASVLYQQYNIKQSQISVYAEELDTDTCTLYDLIRLNYLFTCNFFFKY